MCDASHHVSSYFSPSIWYEQSIEKHIFEGTYPFCFFHFPPEDSGCHSSPPYSETLADYLLIPCIFSKNMDSKKRDVPEFLYGPYIGHNEHLSWDSIFELLHLELAGHGQQSK